MVPGARLKGENTLFPQAAVYTYESVYGAQLQRAGTPPPQFAICQPRRNIKGYDLRLRAGPSARRERVRLSPAPSTAKGDSIFRQKPERQGVRGHEDSRCLPLGDRCWVRSAQEHQTTRHQTALAQHAAALTRLPLSAKPKATRELSRVAFGTNCRICSGSIHLLETPLNADA
jgi:hypothetical protein